MIRRVRAILVFGVLLGAGASVAANPPASAPPSAASAAPAAPAAAPLEIGGRVVTTFRATTFGYRPVERAQDARARLLRAYEKNHVPVLGDRHIAEGSQVLVDGTVMFVITPADVNALAGETPEQAATLAIGVLRQVVAELEERGDPAALGRGIGFAAVVTLVAVLLWRLIFALDRRVGLSFSRRVAERAGEVKFSGVSMLDPAFLLRVARKAIHALAWAFAAIVAYLWINGVLESLPFTRPWGEKLTGLLVDLVVSAGQGFLEALPGLIFVVLIVVVARLVVRATEYFFDQVENSETRMGWLDRHTARPTRIIVSLLVWVLAIAMAYPYFPGSESRAFQGLSVLVGVMVSIGASSIVGQAASGLILMYTRTFHVGEYVKFQDVEGTVVQLGIFATRVRTGLGDEVTLPNSLALASISRNYSAGVESGFIVNATMTIGYDTPWRQVHAMMQEAVRRTPGMVSEPAASIFQTALSDFYVEYRLAAHCIAQDAASRMEATSRLHANLIDVFNEHGVQIMSPHYLGDPESPKVVPPAKRAPAPAVPGQDRAGRA
jgi:small-conductance mechanosensitive channel